MQNLRTIQSGTLFISNNSDLTSLGALSSLETISGGITIRNNPNLQSLAGFDPSRVSGRVTIESNRRLSSTAVEALGERLRQRGFSGVFTNRNNGG